MYSSIEIAGYRGFDSFKLSGLGRVNLLVGTNNSGKTSVLECIEFLQSGGSPSVLRSILTRRGELEPWSAGGRVIPAVKRLFTDHDVVGKRLTIAGAVRDGTKGFGRRVTMYALAAEGDELRPNGDDDPDDCELGEMTPYSLHVESPSLIEPFKTKMTSDGLLPEFRYVRPAQSMLSTALFLRTEGMTVSDVGRYFAEVVLTEREEHVVKALRVVEPAIERIAPVAFELPQLAGGSRSGVYLRLEDLDDRVPIGSLGDGLWRMLGLALALANSAGGVLLVDEIDTGFHYTVMEDMWRMVSERAAALSVQVFATTHSRDCFESLSAIARPELIPSGDVTIQRIDQARDEGIRFGKEAIVAASERGLEVR